MGSLISVGHRDRVHGFVERGRDAGVEVVTGGEHGDGKGAFYKPTVLAAGRELDGSRAGGDLRPRRRGDPVRGREGRGADRERHEVRAVRDGVDRRPRAGSRLARQIKPGWSGSTRRTPPSPASRSAATSSRVRPRARPRDARGLPRDEERAGVDERPPVQPLPACRTLPLPLGGARRGHGGAGELLDDHSRPAGDGTRASRGVRPRPTGRRALHRGGVGRPQLSLLPWGFVTDRIGERRALAIGLAELWSPRRLDGPLRLRARGGLCPDARGRGGRKRPVRERPRGHAVVRAERARARVRCAPDGRAGRRRDRSTSNTWYCPSTGSVRLASAPITPPTGTAVWRTPTRSPRSRGANRSDCAAARRLDASARRGRQHQHKGGGERERSNRPIEATRRRSSATRWRARAPLADPVGDEAPRQERDVSPTHSAAMKSPTPCSPRSYSSRSAAPSPQPEGDRREARLRHVPAASTAQR